MTLPVPSFAALATGNQNLSLFDSQFNAIGVLVDIPCTASGTNAITLTPVANTPAVTAYTDMAPTFSWQQPATTTGPVTIAVAGLSFLNAFTHNGTVAAGSGDFVGAGVYRAYTLAALNNGAGGFVADVIPVSLSATTSTIEYVIDGGGIALTTGLKGYVEVPFACTITRGTLLADQTGSIVVDVFRTAYSTFAPPTHPAAADKITASAPLTISAALKAQDSTLTGWSTGLAAGDILAFNINSVATVQRVSVSLLVTH
jgi:hypothetical protein